MKRGKLYLVPTPLDFGCDEQAPLDAAIPAGTLRVAARLDRWISENAKSTRAFLARVRQVYPLATPLQEQQIFELPREIHKDGDHGGGIDARPWLADALEGFDVGLVSEAGMPAIADPGSSVVRAAHQLGIGVEALPGPISLMLALATSGLNGQHFSFAGYIPIGTAERVAKIGELEKKARATGETQLFIETPYRNQQMLTALLEHLHSNTRLAVCLGLTLASSWNKSATVATWRSAVVFPPLKLPAIFMIGPDAPDR